MEGPDAHSGSISIDNNSGMLPANFALNAALGQAAGNQNLGNTRPTNVLSGLGVQLDTSLMLANLATGGLLDQQQANLLNSVNLAQTSLVLGQMDGTAPLSLNAGLASGAGLQQNWPSGQSSLASQLSAAQLGAAQLGAAQVGGMGLLQNSNAFPNSTDSLSWQGLQGLKNSASALGGFNVMGAQASTSDKTALPNFTDISNLQNVANYQALSGFDLARMLVAGANTARNM